jgi:hypothetical protein
MIRPPERMTASPTRVEAGIVSLKKSLPNRTLTIAKTAPYTRSSFEKSHLAVFTTIP